MMKQTYYVADDLRASFCKAISASQVRRFSSWHDALEYYRNLPMFQVKELGISNGRELLRLVRCLPLSANAMDGEDVLVVDHLLFPMWRKNPSILERARDCVDCLRIRHCLDGAQIVPAPMPQPAGADDPYPRMEGSPVIRWIEVAGDGWLSPLQFERRYPDPGRDYRYPLILKYKVSGMIERHRPVTIEITPLDYRRLARYAVRRRSHI